MFQSQTGCIPLFDVPVAKAMAKAAAVSIPDGLYSPFRPNQGFSAILPSFPWFQSQTGCIPLSTLKKVELSTSFIFVSIPDGLYSPFRRDCSEITKAEWRCFNPRRAVFPFSTCDSRSCCPCLSSFNPRRAVFPFSTMDRKALMSCVHRFQSQTGCIPLFDFIMSLRMHFSVAVSIPDGLYSPFRLDDCIDLPEKVRGFNPRRAVFPFSTQYPEEEQSILRGFNPRRAVFPFST